MHHVSLGATFYDTIIFGAGYAGFAAALASHRAGRRTLLVDRRAALLGESGWAFATGTGRSTEPLWQEWRQRLDRHRAPAAGDCDGAIAEVLATAWVAEEKLPVLYYAAPAAVERSGSGLVTAVIVATKAGPRRLCARQWIDATDDGELAVLLIEGWHRPIPQAQTLTLFFRHTRATALPSLDFPVPGELPDGTTLRWAPGGWPGEQLLSIRLGGDCPQPRQAWLPSLRALHAAVADDLKGAVLTHGSVVPWKTFAATRDRLINARPLPDNVWFAGASGTTLAEKFESGLRASLALTKIASAPSCDLSAARPLPAAVSLRQQDADVVVAGLGTGGAMAAIAAGRQGAKVFGFETMPFPGGVGTGGGLHVYYFGVKGGLQEELDQRVRALMPLFGSTAQVGGFHPEAKKLVLDAMLAEAGVTVCCDTQLHTVRQWDGRVESAMLATRAGPLTVRAPVWIDATGDGDFAAAAGARFRLGRCGDGLLHAYGQSSGRAELSHGVARLHIINFDAGFCDPTDVQDITRARLSGVLQYVQDSYGPEARPTYIAPVLGVRQSRHIQTDYTLTLDDLIERRRFPDAVSYTGCHYDNHARDYEFETDDAAFWVWVCQQWYGRLACEIPFRVLLPEGLKNVVLACRAAGVSEEAHHSVRMQRDMQRLGEVAGEAAALAIHCKEDLRSLPIARLQRRLAASGAIQVGESGDTSFGRSAGSDYFQTDAGRIASWLDELRGGPATAALWHLYRAGDAARPHIVPLLASAEATVSWRAAAVLAMWHDERAEPRLLHAIRTREDDRARDITRPQQEWFYISRWYAAITLLKRCLTVRSLPLLEELAADPQLALNPRNAVALAVGALAGRQPLSLVARLRVEALLRRLLATPAPHAVRSPQGSPLGATEPPSVPRPTDLRPVIEDYTWQLHLAVARARVALGLPPQAEAWRFLDDERAIVRRAFDKLRPGQPDTSGPAQVFAAIGA